VGSQAHDQVARENKPVIYKDLRGFIAEVERVNLLRHVYGAHPNL
jgi:hypothetical protein